MSEQRRDCGCSSAATRALQPGDERAAGERPAATLKCSRVLAPAVKVRLQSFPHSHLISPVHHLVLVTSDFKSDARGNERTSGGVSSGGERQAAHMTRACDECSADCMPSPLLVRLCSSPLSCAFVSHDGHIGHLDLEDEDEDKGKRKRRAVTQRRGGDGQRSSAAPAMTAVRSPLPVVSERMHARTHAAGACESPHSHRTAVALR